LAICSSTAPSKVGSASRTVTSDPSRRHTDPISRPITPEPIMPRRLGIDGMRNAPSLERMWSSSNGVPGSARGFEPVATITWRATSVSSCAPITLMVMPSAPVATNDPRPWKNVTLFFLKRYRMPSLFCFTTASLRPSILSKSTRKSDKTIP
jgi:hypothetical protein